MKKPRKVFYKYISSYYYINLPHLNSQLFCLEKFNCDDYFLVRVLFSQLSCLSFLYFLFYFCFNFILLLRNSDGNVILWTYPHCLRVAGFRAFLLVLVTSPVNLLFDN